ncbi:hypothetical protein A2U01_0052315, partial [Trifolium medium]|nr:hypothetical protein [Trifolium medium]
DNARTEAAWSLLEN